MIRRPPRSTQSRSSAASDVYKRQGHKRKAAPIVHSRGRAGAPRELRARPGERILPGPDKRGGNHAAYRVEAWQRSASQPRGCLQSGGPRFEAGRLAGSQGQGNTEHEGNDLKPVVGIVDYGMGNLRSVEKGFEIVGVAAEVCSIPDKFISYLSLIHI